jgi:hypothetical protein
MPQHDAMIHLSRRQFLHRLGMGFGAIGLSGMLAPELCAGVAADGAAPASALAPRPPHFRARAKRVIHLFMNGGPSHIDTFDPKPVLLKYANKPLKGLPGESSFGVALPSSFKFSKHGQSGLDVSELFPHVAKCADDLCVIRSMHGDEINHEPGIMHMNTGEAFLSRPTIGSWITYGLGTENQNLPGYVVLCPNGMPIGETANWQSSFLPGVYQGTRIDTQHADAAKVIEDIRSQYASRAEQRRQLDLLRKLNEVHRKASPADPRLEARIHSFELAYRMQIEATDAFDLGRESRATRELYGDTIQGRQLLIARRFLERGVRFIQLWHGAGMPWDSHKDLEREHRKLAGECDQAIGAFLKDLKQRGLLDSTLVIWGGEFGRTSSTADNNSNYKDKPGRSHNHHGFTIWLAGGGVKGGYIHGATDEFGSQAVEQKVHVHDLHATILAAVGLDHQRLTYRYSGRDFRLTDLAGEVVKDVFA